MNNKPVILIFEDTIDNASSLERNLAKLSADFDVQIFSAKDNDSSESFVERLTLELNHYHEILLIVSDMDLSKTDKFKGLTDAVIFRVAHELGLPTAYYSTALSGSEGRRLDQAGDGRILLGSTDYEQIAQRISVLANGFQSINALMEEIAANPVDKRPQSPADLIAQLIGRKETADRINLYLSGDQRIAAEILSSPKDGRIKRHATIFGTWIYDSLMRYPGVFLNCVSAASYLNISVDDFNREDVRAVFEKCKYFGPFADEHSPLYWRDEIDRLLANSNVDSGLELVEIHGLNVSPCMCSVDQSLEAGYYCMVTEMPVSFERSVGNISTFPPGADLARLAEPVYDELSPWLSV
ncbi:hypothetical protein LOY52_21710 [Pseudomonas sp. B21-051]|uniref:hypothetical protein n=1 Tax=Pseudomonas sp. B21-051 TaxID=2895491 RepID=UPI00215DED05|nr:hypothetical protein [Pseudomonas sp. B21-051]UVK87450.1 hypothetical protein LOY52_21710 [Pseudomonas sp. B21-051]